MEGLASSSESGSEEIASYRQVTEIIMGALEKVSNLFYTDPAMEPLFQMRSGEGELTKIDHGYDGRIQHARLDAFVVDGEVRFCEFNCDTPSGPGWLDRQSAALPPPGSAALLSRARPPVSC